MPAGPEQAVIQAPAPERLIKGGLPTEAMVAYVLVANTPCTCRSIDKPRCCLPKASTSSILAFWVDYAAAELKPLCLRLRELILASGKIAVDETVAPVLDPSRGRTKKGYFWPIARDDRPWGGTDPPAVAYSYAQGRGAVHALKLLEHYRGIVQRDGYAAYKSIADAACGEAITLAFCGPTCDAGSSIPPRTAPLRSPAKLSRASRRSMRSRKRSGGIAPASGSHAPGKEEASRAGTQSPVEQQPGRVSGKSLPPSEPGVIFFSLTAKGTSRWAQQLSFPNRGRRKTWGQSKRSC
jgi:transposase